MTSALKYSTKLSGLLLFALAAGLLGTSGFVYAADRTVVGELWSADG
jgi:hypothetical protein